VWSIVHKLHFVKVLSFPFLGHIYIFMVNFNFVCSFEGEKTTNDSEKGETMAEE